jgi:hypothetical protein
MRNFPGNNTLMEWTALPIQIMLLAREPPIQCVGACPVPARVQGVVRSGVQLPVFRRGGGAEQPDGSDRLPGPGRLSVGRYGQWTLSLRRGAVRGLWGGAGSAVQPRHRFWRRPRRILACRRLLRPSPSARKPLRKGSRPLQEHRRVAGNPGGWEGAHLPEYRTGADGAFPRAGQRRVRGAPDSASRGHSRDRGEWCSGGRRLADRGGLDLVRMRAFTMPLGEGRDASLWNRERSSGSCRGGHPQGS